MISIEINDDITSGCYRVVCLVVRFYDHTHREERYVHDEAELDEAIAHLFAVAQGRIKVFRELPPTKLVELPKWGR